MLGGNFRIVSFIYVLVFSIIFIVGLAYQVTIPASLYRALLGALLFSVLWVMTVKCIKTFVIHDLLAEKNNADLRGHNLDITLHDEVPLDYPNQEVAASKEVAPDLNTASQQIDPQFTQIISSDPERLAQIVKKMGFEEASR